jgi:GNAT superfamily N-acetyltransferase
VKAQAIGLADAQFAAMQAELRAAGLPTSDLLEGDARYFAFDPHGFGGFVRLGDHALLRSIVVREERRGHGAGAEILNVLLAEACALGCDEIWLLTTSADAFFARRGFAPVPRAEAPAAIAATGQFKELCPDSAVLMRRRLSS